MLFLVCVRRHDDTRFVWSLTGLAIRIAQSLGLHRDGTRFGLSPFDTQMRRRLWWQICILDVRASEDHGSDPSIIESTFDTELPLSINDEDLDPDATEFPAPRPGVSQMTFCLIRYEICHLSRRLSYTPPGLGPCRTAASKVTLEDRERLIKECAEQLEEKYLRFCEDAGPLYWVGATVARLITAKMSLIIYHPLIQPGRPNSLSQDIKDRLFMASIEIIEYSKLLENESTTKQWGWLFHTYIQWHAIAYILGELTSRPPSVIVERAWRTLDTVFHDWDGKVVHSKTTLLWVPMRKLMLKARRKRKEQLAMAGTQGAQILGMDSKNIRPPPLGPGASRGRHGDGRFVGNPGFSSQIARDRVLEQASSSTVNSTYQSHGLPKMEGGEYVFTTSPVSMTGQGQFQSPAGTMGSSSFATEPMQAPPQMQQPQQQQAQNQNQDPAQWLMDDSNLLDLDMQGIDGDINWDGWDDMVRDFQMETDVNVGRGPAVGGMGSWW